MEDDDDDCDVYGDVSDGVFGQVVENYPFHELSP